MLSWGRGKKRGEGERGGGQDLRGDRQHKCMHMHVYGGEKGKKD